jgi:hypothetical protein
MAKVTGIGGVFFKSRDPQSLRGWYRDLMGIDVQSWGGAQFFFNLSSGNRVTTTLPRRRSPKMDKGPKKAYELAG